MALSEQSLEEGPRSEEDDMISIRPILVKRKKTRYAMLTFANALAGGEVGGDRPATAQTVVEREWPELLLWPCQAAILVVTFLDVPMDLTGIFFRALPFAGIVLLAYIMIDTIRKWGKMDPRTIDKGDELFEALRDGKAKLALSLLMWLTAFILGFHFEREVSGGILVGVEIAEQFQSSKAVQNLKEERAKRKYLEGQQKELAKANKALEEEKATLEYEMTQAKSKFRSLEDELKMLQENDGSQDEIKKKEAELDEMQTHIESLVEEARALNRMLEKIEQTDADARKRIDSLNKSRREQTRLLKAEFTQEVTRLNQEIARLNVASSLRQQQEGARPQVEVEVPQVEYVETIVHVPKIVTEEKIVEVEVPQVEYVETFVHVPKVVTEKKIVEVEVPHVEYVEEIVHVPKVVTQTIEKIVEVEVPQ